MVQLIRITAIYQIEDYNSILSFLVAMRISKLQRSMLEKLWRESSKVPVQLVADILNVRIKSKEIRERRIDPMDHNDNEIIRKLITQQLLTHLNEVRKIAFIKTETF